MGHTSMANLLSVLARKEREEFFLRLDSEWGRGCEYRTKSDRCPNPFVVTAPRTDLQDYIVRLYNIVKIDGEYYERQGSTEDIWRTQWRELAEAYVGTLKADGFKARVKAHNPTPLSKNQAADIASLIATFRLGCQNQTVVRRANEVQKPKVYRSLKLMGIKPEPVIPSFVPAPKERKPEPIPVAPNGAQLPIAQQLNIFGIWEPVWKE